MLSELNRPLVKLDKSVFWGAVLIALLLVMFGCSGLGSLSGDEVTEVVAIEVVEAIPIVASNPTMPGVLTAVISIVAGIAGAAFGAAGQKVSIKKKIEGGALGKQAVKDIDSL